jgi:hypothetical protein
LGKGHKPRAVLWGGLFHLYYEYVEARAEARFNRARKAGSISWQMKTAAFWASVCISFIEAGGGDVSAYR